MTAPREMDDFRQALYLIADEMRGMATLAKQFGNVYEAERAHRIMEIAARVAALADDRPTAEIQAFFEAEPWLRISPAVGVDAFVVNTDAEILLVQRRDNSRWCMPGGVAEIGQTFAEAVLRELWEEAGLRGEVKRLLGVFDGRIWGSPDKVHLMNMVFQVECRDLSPKPGLETLDARFFPRDRLPHRCITATTCVSRSALRCSPRRRSSIPPHPTMPRCQCTNAPTSTLVGVDVCSVLLTPGPH
ncbi:MAG TPA: NUDIX domain-containing protein [Dehalococcoidia bacterium]|nr:NUDIX domain-containing protein [Dehalococcoidia bacterium]